MSTPSIHDGLAYIADCGRRVSCIDVQTGKSVWVHRANGDIWASTLVADGKVYLGDEDGDVVVLQHGKELKVLAEMNMGSAVYSTAVPAHGMLFLNNRSQLFALAGQ